MKNRIYSTLVLSIFVISVAFAQNPAYQNGVSFKALFMDYQSQNGGNISEFKSYHHGLEIGYHLNLQPNINLVVPAKIGVVRSHDLEASSSIHKTIYGLDAQLQYQHYKPNTKVTPYFLAGVGGVYEDQGDFNVQIPFGLGFFFQAADNAYINWQSEYRVALSDDRNNLHHGLGFVYLINRRAGATEEMPKDIDEIMIEETDSDDSDGDGIVNDLDLCPQSPGSRELNGCPDKDLDGIADYKDACPNTPGLRAFKGCPDSDSDGISDNEDECPNMPGKISNKGCPDNDDDSDGVPNDIDRCPNIAGVASNGGCPEIGVTTGPAQRDDRDGDGIKDVDDKCPDSAGTAATDGCPDTDGDGVHDALDKCPYAPGIKAYGGCPDSDGDGIDDSRDSCPGQFGSVANNGCPDVAKEDRDLLELAMRAVQFDTGKATLKSESYRVLNQIGDIMFRYPNFKLSIDGHTDNTGGANNNQKLSERRAQACYEYLLKKGVPADQLRFQGFGESKPISNNNTLRGRALNRRVEFNLSPR